MIPPVKPASFENLTGQEKRDFNFEAVSKFGFSFEISRRWPSGQEREAEDQPAGILKYVEDLRRGLNADIGRKDFFEMTSNKSTAFGKHQSTTITTRHSFNRLRLSEVLLSFEASALLMTIWECPEPTALKPFTTKG